VNMSRAVGHLEHYDLPVVNVLIATSLVSSVRVLITP
jgi:hypothetical protein